MLVPARVLIADPDDGRLASYRASLGRHGFEVATAPDGLACVRLLRDFVPDLLVLSPALPWGGGDGVLAQMRDDPTVVSVPVIVLSSGRDFDGSPRLWDFPIAEYHSHPVSSELLARRIRLMLAGADLAPQVS